MSTETWIESDTYRTQTLTRVTPHGVFRARLDLDDEPHAPECHGSDPVIDTESGELVYGGGHHTGTGEHPAVSRVLEAFDRTRRSDDWWGLEWDTETWERYVRVFHNGTVRWINGGSRGEEGRYAVVALPEYRTDHGYREIDGKPEATEWEAYVEGDVWTVTVEQAAYDPDTGELDWDFLVTELECVGGYYGEKWAREEAREQLPWWIADKAESMLPVSA